MSISAMKRALEALDIIKASCSEGRVAHAENEAAIAEYILRQAIAEAENIIKKGAYLSTSTSDDEKPLSDHQRQEIMSMIDYALTLASWGKSTRPRTAPPKREWVGLTAHDKAVLIDQMWNQAESFEQFMDSIDKFLAEKNT